MNPEQHRPPTWHTITSTALGDLTLVRDAEALRGVYYLHHWHRPDVSTFGARIADGFEDVTVQIAQYLAGTRREFDLPLAPYGDELQRRVWSLIQHVSYGDTVTYGQLAADIGGGVTAQQVGALTGQNPLSIVIPCHRVVGAGGKLTGYAGGIARKRMLLELEQDHVARTAHRPYQGSLIDIR